MGVVFGMLLPLLRNILNVSFLIGGIVIAIFFHSLSVLLVGESTVLRPQNPVVFYEQPLIVALVTSLICALITVLFFGSSLGLRVRYFMDVNDKATFAEVNWLGFVGFGVTGLIVGIGAFSYTHINGLARSGGSFEYLVVALTAYVAILRSGEVLFNRSSVSASYAKNSLAHATDAPISPMELALYAAAGAFALQAIMYATIYYSPVPQAWRAIFAIVLCLAIVSFRDVPSNLADLVSSWGRLRLGEVPAAACKLRVRDLTKSIVSRDEERVLFDSFNAVFEPGLNLITGENGGGKTTLLKAIHGKLRVSAGDVTFGGQALHESAVFYMRQDAERSFATSLTVKDSIASMAGLAPSVSSHALLQAIEEACQTIEISLWDEVRARNLFDRSPYELSGGELRYVSVLAMLASLRPVVMLDEPTANLDQDNRVRIRALITAAAQKREQIFLIVSHDPEFRENADQVFNISASTRKENT